jgi:hypothetical protein
MERSLKKGYVAQNILKPISQDVALRRICASRQHYYGKIRPRWLRFYAFTQS